MLRFTQENPSDQESREGVGLDRELVNLHMANERTFLAWICTGILLMGCGVAVAKMRIALSDFSQTAGVLPQSTGPNVITPVTMGMMFLVLGLVTIVMAAYRFLAVQDQLRELKYRVSNGYILVFLLLLLIMGFTLMWHVALLRQVLE